MLDPRLRGFVEAPDDDEAERRLGTLLEDEAGPLIRRIAARKLHAHAGDAVSRQDLEDVVADALLALVSRLQSLRADPTSDPIENFADYTAAVSYHTFAHYLRRKHPERSRLKNRLRYVLTREGRLGLWQTQTGPCCGLAAWRPAPASAAATERLDRLIAEPERWLRWMWKGRASRDDPTSLLVGILRAIDGPVEFDRLVGVIGRLYPRLREDRVSSSISALPDESAPPADLALDRQRLTQRLWLEIGSLPLRQRAALLLHLRDDRGASVLWVFPLTATASIRQIARVLEMPDLELAELWKRLPLDDRTIAERLGCSRQQVINLRSAARKRLSNRLNPRGAAGVLPDPGNTPAFSASLQDKA